MTDEKSAYAHDPITNEDVPIRCSPKHQNTDYDRIDGETLPVLIRSDFRHDPVEACQGSYTEIAEIPDGCPNCGYDRMNVAVHTLAGVHQETCRACGVDITERGDDDWEPTKPHDPVERLRTNADFVARIDADMMLYARNAERGLYALLKNGKTYSLTEDEAVDLGLAVLRRMDEGDLDRVRGRQLLYAATSAVEPKEEDDE